MDSIVTARVPIEIKNQAAQMLAQMGSNTTKLINAAFEYLLATGELPRAARSAPAPARRSLSNEQRAELTEFFCATSSPAPASFWNELGDRSYKEAMATWRKEDYEALA